ncbi:ABC transporter substrate-binding protein [Listeria riparia]|uniref:Iron ABC transporter substrate-binding protein n=1 Tax=Listeria riparia FSL S10-1204 TaxID=1265816 RepID=W7D5X0_9LIST|nr:ABC transporter substrate-binding protein [Listeria riparia]EUJ44622.1 iron ABC transporter substrate-binding protein [Listeria riparia FSL S10-1204]
MKKIIFISIISLLLVLVTACGPKDVTSSNTTNETSNKQKVAKEDVVLSLTDMAGRTVQFTKKPERIITLTNSDMGIVYALGGSVVGRQTMDASGVEPSAALKATEVGNTHDLNLEKIASLTPDVIVASSEQNLKDVPALESIGAQVVLTGANSIADIKKQEAILAQLLGKDATKLQQEIDTKVADIKQEQKGKAVRALLILGAPGSNYAALPNSLSGDILEKAGGVNVAKDFKGVENFPQYASLNIERIVQADPEVIFLMIHGGDEKETEIAFQKELKQNDAWNSTTAVKNNNIVVLPADLFGTNPGIRITKALDFMANELNQVQK